MRFYSRVYGGDKQIILGFYRVKEARGLVREPFAR